MSKIEINMLSDILEHKMGNFIQYTGGAVPSQQVYIYLNFCITPKQLLFGVLPFIHELGLSQCGRHSSSTHPFLRGIFGIGYYFIVLGATHTVEGAASSCSSGHVN